MILNPWGMPQPSPWNYSSTRTDTVSKLVQVSGNGADDQTQTDTTQTVTQDGTVSASGQDDGEMVFHAEGTIHRSYTFSDTDSIGNTQSESFTDHQHYIFDDTQGRGLSAGTPAITASGDGYVHGSQSETWGTIAPGSNGFSHSTFANSDYTFNYSSGTGPTDWTTTQNAEQGLTFQTSYFTVTDEGLTVNSTVNASETDTAMVTSSASGSPTISLSEMDSLVVHADITGPDGGSTTFDASVGQSLGTNDILLAQAVGPAIEVGRRAGKYIRSMKQPNQPDLPLHVISPNLTPLDIRNSYWNHLATQWNNGLFAWPFTGTPGQLTGGSGIYQGALDPRPVAGTLRFPPPEVSSFFNGIVLQPYWSPPDAQGKQHLWVSFGHYKAGYRYSMGTSYDTGVTR